MASIRQKEATMTIAGKPAPEAYLFITNRSDEYNLETTDFSCVVLSEGFKIPELRFDSDFQGIHEALRAREKHREMNQLMASLRRHYEIPSTFDGEISEFAFGRGSDRLRIGDRYLIGAKNGRDVVGKLVDGFVSVDEGLAYGAYKLDNGQSIIATTPLTDLELSAYRRYPDTFFGVHKRQVKSLGHPLEIFDWLYETYSHTPREKLLEFMQARPDHERLKSATHEELAGVYCEDLVLSLMESNPTFGPTRSRLDLTRVHEKAE